MRLRTLVCFLLFTLCLPAEQQFDGTWKMDDKKSPSGKFAPGNLEQQIKVNGSEVVVKSKYDEPKTGMYPLMWIGIMTQDLKLSADGSEVINHIGPFLHKSKTTIDGNKMTTDFNATIENGFVNGQWIRTLSPDGKEMTLQILAKASDGRNADLTLTFKKK